MARKTNEHHKPEVLLRIVERYYAEKKPSKKPKYSELGAYARSIGYEINDFIFQRSKEVKDYINKKSSSDDEEALLSVAVYDTLDTDRFLAVNNTPQKLKNALQERDMYYHNVCISAGKLFEKSKEVSEQLVKAREKNKALESEVASLSEKLASYTSECKRLKASEQRLRGILETYIYPEIANELLKKEGLLKNTAGMIKEEAIENETITGKSDVDGLIKSMFKMVDED